MKKGMIFGAASLLFLSPVMNVNAVEIITGLEESDGQSHVVCNQCQCTATYRTVSKTSSQNQDDYTAEWNLNITDDVLNDLGINQAYNIGNVQVQEFTQSDWAAYVSDKRDESLGLQWDTNMNPCSTVFQSDWSQANPNKLPSSTIMDTDSTQVTVDQSGGQINVNVQVQNIQLGSGNQTTVYDCNGGGATVRPSTSFPVKFSFDFTTEEDCDLVDDNARNCTPTVSSSLSCSPGVQMSDTEDWQNCILDGSLSGGSSGGGSSSGGSYGGFLDFILGLLGGGYRPSYSRPSGGGASGGGPMFANNVGLGNKYCKVNCREDISFSFPATATYLAGNHFTYEPIQVIEERECRSEVIDYNTFKSDFESFNESYKTHYLCSKNMGMRNSSCCLAHGAEKCTTDPETGKETCVTPCVSWGSYNYSSCGGYSTSCSKNPPNMLSSWKSQEKEIANEAERSRDTALKNLKNCYDWDALSDIPTTVNVSYNDPTGHYSWSGAYPSSGAGEIELDNTTDEYRKDPISYYYCSGNSCVTRNDWVVYRSEPKEVETADGSKIKKKVRAIKTFRMPNNGIYQYVLKPSGESVHAGSQYGNYIDVGYSNFPIHYSTPTGTYYMGITFTNFGHKGRFSNGVAASVASASTQCPYNVRNIILEEDDQDPGCPIETCDPGQTLINPDSINCSCSGKKTDSCPITKCKAGYTLVNPHSPYCYCKPISTPTGNDLKGLNVIYRPIDLDNPFPSIDGDGRKSGSNWQGYFEDYVDLYITNNRDVETEEVYNLEPLYKITLTPFTIKAIRDYNNEQKNNDRGYDDFNFNCTTGTGKECIMTKFATRFGSIFDNISTCYGANHSNFDRCRY